MSEMVERTAKAIAARMASFSDNWKVGWFCEPDYEKLACAAIAAMREPTKGDGSCW